MKLAPISPLKVLNVTLETISFSIKSTFSIKLMTSGQSQWTQQFDFKCSAVDMRPLTAIIIVALALTETSVKVISQVGNSSVVAPGNSSVVAPGNSSVVAPGNSTVGNKSEIVTTTERPRERDPRCIPPWDYRGEKGQDHWCCIGHRMCCEDLQSPINIDINRAVYDSNATCLNLHNYECAPTRMALFNTGRMIELQITPNNSTLPVNITSSPYVDGGHLPRFHKYVLDRIVFHWGRNTSYGSEHTLNNMRLPLEMQLIHRLEKYRDLNEARFQPDGYLIISVFFIPAHEDNNDIRDLIYHLHKVTFQTDRYCVKPFPIKKLLPPTYGYYYHYNGSLTIPPCTQNVQWIIFHNPVFISEYQLNEFRRLQRLTHLACPKVNCPMVDNYRKTVCQKNRVVKWKEECHPMADCSSYPRRYYYY